MLTNAYLLIFESSPDIAVTIEYDCFETFIAIVLSHYVAGASLEDLLFSTRSNTLRPVTCPSDLERLAVLPGSEVLVMLRETLTLYDAADKLPMLRKVAPFHVPSVYASVFAGDPPSHSMLGGATTVLKRHAPQLGWRPSIVISSLRYQTQADINSSIAQHYPEQTSVFPTLAGVHAAPAPDPEASALALALAPYVGDTPVEIDDLLADLPSARDRLDQAGRLYGLCRATIDSVQASINAAHTSMGSGRGVTLGSAPVATIAPPSGGPEHFLDLHGYSHANARTAVQSLIRTHQTRLSAFGAIVVTGKGIHTPKHLNNGQAVLQPAVARWLENNEVPARYQSGYYVLWPDRPMSDFDAQAAALKF